MEKEIPQYRLEAAARLRAIRENAGYTQEAFSEILDMSVSAYKKIESGANQISLTCLRKMYTRMNISADYLLFGEISKVEEIWREIMVESETEKMVLMLKLMHYFAKKKDGIFPFDEEQDDNIYRMLKELK